MSYIYVAKNGDAGVVISTAITILQIKAGAAALELLRAGLSQGLSETSTMEHVQILRKTAAATVTSFTPRRYNPSDPVSLAVGGTAATGYTASAEGTDGEVLLDDGWNILNGWQWKSGEDRILVPQGGILAMKFPVAPASATYRAYMVFAEYQ
jgi:hypothetical protein